MKRNSTTTFAQAGCSQQAAVDLFVSQLTARSLDLMARELKQLNRGYYTIGSAGHEGNAAIARAFRHTDMAFLHYRSGAFMHERARALPDINMIGDVLLSLMAAKADPIAQGRHKVFGSLPLHVPPQTSTIASHLPKAVGAAMSIQRAQTLNINRVLPNDAVILCSFGDASVNHSVATGAFNQARWIAQQHYSLPLVFICEDNGLGISVPTPEGWIESQFVNTPGLVYLQADGLNIADVLLKSQQAEHVARIEKKPVFLHMKCVRLLGHAGTDIESQYLTPQQIAEQHANDPLLHTEQLLLEQGLLTKDEVTELKKQIDKKVAFEAEKIGIPEQLSNAFEVMDSIVPKIKGPSNFSENQGAQSDNALPNLPSHKTRQALSAEKFSKLSEPLNLSQSINAALADILMQYDNTIIFGEDVAKKGGVYRVTADLQKMFSQTRVFDALLDETSILGQAIGHAHNGFLPIPEIQFLSYLHNAIDQLRGEAATLSFFSNSQFTNPMVIRIASFGYQKGFGGHFHNENSIAALRDIPGIIIACPSRGDDAAKMLRECIELAYLKKRIIVFLEPIALYMTKDLHEKGDGLWACHYPELGEQISFDEVGVSGALSAKRVVITYGNGHYLTHQAAKILKDQHGIDLKILDLRWLKPLPLKSLLGHLHDCDSILVVDEGRETASISEQLIVELHENIESRVAINRLTGKDSFITLGDSWRLLLPSTQDIVQHFVDEPG